MFDMSSNSSSKYQQFRRLYIPNIFNFLLKAKIKNSKSCQNRACKSSFVGIIKCIEISMPLSWLIQTVWLETYVYSPYKYITIHLFVNWYCHEMKMILYKMLNDDYRQVKTATISLLDIFNELNKIHHVYHLLKFACKLHPCWQDIR